MSSDGGLKVVQGGTNPSGYTSPWSPPNIDAWAALDHKMVAGTGQPYWSAAPWIPQGERRRLNAYLVLAAYMHNNARSFLPWSAGIEARLERREYGDPALLVDTAHAAMLGDEQQIVVDLLPGTPTDDGSDDDEESDAEEAAEDAAEAARAKRAAWLEDWADRERFWLKLAECEKNAVGLGDGVYVLGWSAKHQRVRVRQYEPNAYFPVLTGDEDIDEFPGKVHLAWELAPENANAATLLRRITWELVPLDDTHDGVTPVIEDGVVVGWERTYPWAPDAPSRVTCVMSDGTWRLADSAGRGMTDLSESKAMWAVNEDGFEVRRLDIGVDFIPVVHVASW